MTKMIQFARFLFYHNDITKNRDREIDEIMYRGKDIRLLGNL